MYSTISERGLTVTPVLVVGALLLVNYVHVVVIRRVLLFGAKVATRDQIAFW